MSGNLCGASVVPAENPIKHYIGSDSEPEGVVGEVPDDRGTFGGGGTDPPYGQPARTGGRVEEIMAEAGGTVGVSGTAVPVSGAGG